MNIYTEVLNSKDTTQIVKHDNYYSYFNRYGAYTNCYGPMPDEIPTNTYFYRCPYLSFGDYDNSCVVERANVRVFLEEFFEFNGSLFHHVKGDYNSESIYIDITCTNTEIIDTLNNLFDYPAINDEVVNEIEMEIEMEYWESIYKGEFLEAIQKKFDGWNIDCSDDNKLLELYHELKESTNTYFEVEAGGNGYIRIESLVDALELIPDFITIDKN